MSLLVDTSVWSLALRRDAELQTPEVVVLRNAMHCSELTRCSAPGSCCRNSCWVSLARKHATASWNALLPWPSSSRIAKTISKPQKSAIPAAVMAFKSAPLTLYSSNSVADTISNFCLPTTIFDLHRATLISASGARVMAAEHSLQCGRWPPAPLAQRSNASL